MEGLNNIYQKGATITCHHCPMAELRRSLVILWQLGAPEEESAVNLQTEFLRAVSATLSVEIKDKGYHEFAPKKREVYFEGEEIETSNSGV